MPLSCLEYSILDTLVQFCRGKSKKWNHLADMLQNLLSAFSVVQWWHTVHERGALLTHHTEHHSCIGHFEACTAPCARTKSYGVDRLQPVAVVSDLR